MYTKQTTTNAMTGITAQYFPRHFFKSFMAIKSKKNRAPKKDKRDPESNKRWPIRAIKFITICYFFKLKHKI